MVQDMGLKAPPVVCDCNICRPVPGVIAKKQIERVTPISESALRKRQPLVRGALRYFPDALLAVAELSLYGNEKHNPGEELHWSRGKSNDHADCVVRHLLEPFGVDTGYGEGKHVLHSVAAAWRALANAQVEIEELRKQGKWPLNAI